MKKRFLKPLIFLFALNMIATGLFAQGAYVSVNGGYGLATARAVPYNIYFMNYSSEVGRAVFGSSDISLGHGFNGGAAFGYMFTKNFGAELGISYLIGAESKATEKGPSYNFNFTVSSNMLRAMPSLIIAAGFERINPYAKFGLIMGYGDLTYRQAGLSDDYPASITWKYDGGVAVGINSGIGVLCRLTRKLSLYGELDLVNMAYAPTRGEATEYMMNGVDQLPDLPVRFKKVKLVDPLIDDWNNTSPETEPGQTLKQNLPYSSFGLNVGLRVNL